MTYVIHIIFIQTSNGLLSFVNAYVVVIQETGVHVRNLELTVIILSSNVSICSDPPPSGNVGEMLELPDLVVR